MKEALLVFLGSGIGGVLRYGLSGFIQKISTSLFPVGILTTNVIACFLVGILAGYLSVKIPFSEHFRLFWIIGLCGGFSTFSSFTSETVYLLHHDQWVYAFLYILASLVLCVSANLLGVYIINR